MHHHGAQDCCCKYLRGRLVEGSSARPGLHDDMREEKRLFMRPFSLSFSAENAAAANESKKEGKKNKTYKSLKVHL